LPAETQLLTKVQTIPCRTRQVWIQTLEALLEERFPWKVAVKKVGVTRVEEVLLTQVPAGVPQVPAEAAMPLRALNCVLYS